MAKQALNGLLAGFLTFAIVLFSFFLLHLFGGKFVGTFCAATIFFALIFAINPANPLRISMGRWPGWNRRLLKYLLEEMAFLSLLVAGAVLLMAGAGYLLRFKPAGFEPQPVDVSFSGLAVGALLALVLVLMFDCRRGNRA